MLPVWVYVVVAVAIALVAFGIGQIAPGFGVAFVALTTTAWTAYSANRHRKLDRNC